MSASKFLITTLPVMTTNNDIMGIVKASTDFGGMTIVKATYWPAATTNAGTSHVLHLMNYGTSGTVAGGTVGSVGGTASPYTTLVPAEFTLVAAQVFIDAGEWLVLKKTQEGADSDIAANASLVIEYVDGVVLIG
jgi:hypothetical protein